MCGLFFACSKAKAEYVYFNWDNITTWTAGSLSGSFDIDPVNPGNDVTITITGDTSTFVSGYPADVAEMQGGHPTIQDSLKTYLDWTAAGQSITITIDFNYANGVRLAELHLFDIDADTNQVIIVKDKGKDVPLEIPNTKTWVDVITNIQATAVGGGTLYPTNVVGAVNNTVTGSGSTWAITGTSPAPSTNAGSGGGNVDIYFDNNFFTQIKYTWVAGDGTVTDPAAQLIGVFDFSWHSKIPEFHPGLVSASLCGLLGAFRYGRRAWSARSQRGGQSEH